MLKAKIVGKHGSERYVDTDGVGAKVSRLAAMQAIGASLHLNDVSLQKWQSGVTNIPALDVMHPTSGEKRALRRFNTSVKLAPFFAPEDLPAINHVLKRARQLMSPVT